MGGGVQVMYGEKTSRRMPVRQNGHSDFHRCQNGVVPRKLNSRIARGAKYDGATQTSALEFCSERSKLAFWNVARGGPQNYACAYFCPWKEIKRGRCVSLAFLKVNEINVLINFRNELSRLFFSPGVSACFITLDDDPNIFHLRQIDKARLRR